MISSEPKVAAPLTAPGLPVVLRGGGLTGAGGTDAAGVESFTRFERARIIGARALQVSLGAPILTEIPPTLIDPVEIAEREFAANAIPITVRRGRPR